MFYRTPDVFEKIEKSKENNLIDDVPESAKNQKPEEGSVRQRFQKIDKSKDYTKNEPFPEKAKRNAAQNLARSAETYVGYPGNFKQAFQQSRKHLESTLGLPDADAELEKAFGKRDKESWLDTIFNPPTSSELRQTATKNISEKLTGDREYLEPKNKLEEGVGEFTQDLTSFFIPGTNQFRLMTRIGSPIVGNAVKHGAKYLGASDETTQNLKNGLMLATTLAGQSNPRQFARDRIAQARNMVPENATVGVGSFIDRLVPLYNRLRQGLRVPSKSRTVQGMQELLEQADDGRISLRSLMQARDDINEWIAEAGGWDVPANTRDATVRNLNEFKTSVIETINEHLNNRFPQAAELYQTGYEAAAAVNRSNVISNFLEKKFGSKLTSVGAKLLFPAAAGGAAFLPKTVGVASLTYPLYKTGQVLYRVGRSPTLSRYYQNVISASASGNTLSMVHNLKKLDKALAEEEKKENLLKKPSLEEFKERFKSKSKGKG